MLDIFGAFVAVQPGLGLSGFDPLEEMVVHGNAGGAGEAGGEAFGLVESTFAAFGGVKGNRNEEIALLASEDGRSGADEEVGEERLEPELAVVFVAMDDFEHQFVRGDGGTGGAEM